MNSFAASVLVVSSLIIFCKSAQKVKETKPLTFQDNYWYSDEKLQIVTEEIPPFVSGPYTFAQEKSCEKAKNKIEPKILRLYPRIKNIEYKQVIKHTLYYGAAGCRLIVHIEADHLKNDISIRS